MRTDDVPLLEAIISKSWGKDDELKQLKSDLAALGRKITAALAPTHEVPDDRMGVNHDEKDGEEVKQQADTPRGEVRDNSAQSINSKESMVAEPSSRYVYPRASSGSDFSPNSSFRAVAPKF